MSNVTKMVDGLKNPSLDYSPVMMWFWNGDISEEGITYQLESYRKQNIVNFFIHPAAGTKLEYLSNRYMELIKHTVKEAKRLGMKYWIYDEYEYPSGTVGGQLLKKYPHLRQKEITYVVEWLNPVGMSVTTHQRGKLLSAISIKEKNDRYYVIDITDKCIVEYTGTGSVNVTYQNDQTVFEQIVFFFERYNESPVPSGVWAPGEGAPLGYMNIINREAVAKFIEMTHEKYKEAIGDEFGKTVMGVFTDEPTSLRHFGPPAPGPWDDSLLQEFEKEHGYSLMPYLYTLFYAPKTAEEIKARDDYRTTIKHLYHKNFIGQYSDWCRENNLLLTGHFGGEEFLGGSIEQGDMQTELMKMDIPGCDSIFPTMKIDYHNYNVAAKLVAGAAKYSGADRVLCEAYTGGGWELDFTIMKHIANRLAILGVNMLQYMGGHYTIRGTRKLAPGILPSSHTYTNKLFRHYHLFNKYVAGISSLSAATKPDGKVLVLNPLREAIQDWNMTPACREKIEYKPLQLMYESVINGLLWAGIEYDLFSEDLVKEIKVCDGYVEAFGYRYECIVFPGMFHVNKETAELLKAITDKGIKTVLIGKVPTKVSETKEETGFVFDYDASKAEDVVKNGSCYLVVPEQKETPKELSELYKEIFADIIGGASLGIKTDSRVYIAKRSNEDAEVYFIANDENRTVTAEIDALPGMKIYNTTSGEEAAYPVSDKRVTLTLEAYELVAVIRDKASDEEYAPLCESYSRTMEYPLSGDYTFEAVGGNILPIRSFETFDKDTQKWVRGDYMSFADGVTFTVNEDYKIRAEVNFEYIPSVVHLNAEIYEIKKLCINGTEVELSANTVLWSEADCRCDVTKLLKVGVNTIEIDGVTDSIPLFKARPPFVFFTGKFAVDKNDTVVRPSDYMYAGGWEKQGYPYFVGDGVYRSGTLVHGMEFNSSAKVWSKAVLKFKTNCFAKVYVNGQFAGDVLWAPTEIDITPYLHFAHNNFKIVFTSTYANLFDKHTENGLLEGATIVLYK
ncbi:MAG: hypothetical protein IKV89_03040 [Clostridia bacterium]|nr:hypothetical protein [Clostridia bacterium]